jgi:ribonuclease Z
VHFKLTVLGSNAAKPAHGRFTSSQVLENEQYAYLIDAGEGCQIRLSQYKIKRNRIKAIFISHLHGDHLFGLPGVLTSFFHFSRTSDLRIIGPIGIKKFVESVLSISESHIQFKLLFTELNADSLTQVYKDSKIEVFAFPLNHRIPTNGYLFRTMVKPPNLIKSKISEYGLTVDEIKSLKSGQEVTRESGERLKVEEFTEFRTHPASYAYCSDTRYDESIVPYIKNINCLYHESTYDHSLVDKAKERGHSTSKEAALIAKSANAKQLLIGHFSSIYRYPSLLLEEARSVFPKTDLAYDGGIFYIKTDNK